MYVITLGLWYRRKGRFHKAEQYLPYCREGPQKRNPNPYVENRFMNLGLASGKYQGRCNEAYDRFCKEACWNAAWQDPGYFACAADFYYPKTAWLMHWVKLITR